MVPLVENPDMVLVVIVPLVYSPLAVMVPFDVRPAEKVGALVKVLAPLHVLVPLLTIPPVTVCVPLNVLDPELLIDPLTFCVPVHVFVPLDAIPPVWVHVPLVEILVAVIDENTPAPPGA